MLFMAACEVAVLNAEGVSGVEAAVDGVQAPSSSFRAVACIADLFVGDMGDERMRTAAIQLTRFLFSLQ